MAIVVSHAMRRFATSPDANYSSCGLRSENPRLTWPQETESSLSRSMRYADPWLYDSVRSPNRLLLAPALVLCSCSDYLNGTKRSNKKGPTTCKKCKGTRIPLSNGETKFGTMRCFPTKQSLASTPTRAGTVRVTSSSRASILPNADPYDLMRRSRLTVKVSENTSPSQFRARSASPKKVRATDSRSSSATRHKSNAKYSTLGRKSILECNVNPYELMTTEGEATEASITLVNGQRIRVRPPVIEPDCDYEDVHIHKPIGKPIQINKIRIKSPPMPSPKSNEKESDCNRFKSILKKPTTTFSDTDSTYSRERSPSPAFKTGSQFYIPMPGTARKKVQFLVENELCSLDQSNISIEYMQEDEPSVNEDGTGKEIVVDESDLLFNSCKLRRSESDRPLKEQTTKVVFHDSMALRTNQPRTDARTLFSDLERLDGTSNSRLGQKTRPKDPPPQPPSRKSSEDEIFVQDISNGTESLVIDETFAPAAPPRKRSNNKQPIINAIINELTEKLENTVKNKDFPIFNGNNVKSEKKFEVISDQNTDDVDYMKKYEKVLISQQNNDKNLFQTNDNIGKYNTKTCLLNNDEIMKNNVFKPEKDEPIVLNKVIYPNYNKNSIKDNNKIIVQNHEPEPNKTVLQINGNSSVHKLKIKNEFPESNNINTISISDNNQGKTSIMINGDDCYSTIKVCDEIPLYHSSVVVKDSGIIVENRRSSSVYITGNFVNSYNDDVKGFKNCIDNVKTKENEEEVVMRNKNISNIDLMKCLSDPVEAVRRNLVPHVCGKLDVPRRIRDMKIPIMKVVNSIESNVHNSPDTVPNNCCNSINEKCNSCSVCTNDALIQPNEVVPNYNTANNVYESVSQTSSKDYESKHYESANLYDSASQHYNTPPDLSSNSCPTKPQVEQLSEEDKVAKFIEESFLKLRNNNLLEADDKDACSEHSSSTQYEIMDHGSECYTDHSNRSSVTEEELNARTKFYELLADSTVVEVSENEDHHYESIKLNPDPIYEEIEIPPPLPSNPPPSSLLDDLQLDKEYTTRSIFEGASKYDILSYLVDAKERGIVPEDSYTYNFGNSDVIIEEEGKDSNELPYNRVSHLSTVSDSSEDSSLVMSCSMTDDKVQRTAEVERNDSGVGSETSKSSLSKYRSKPDIINTSCEDCESSLDFHSEHEPLICRKCVKKRTERKEIITEIVETEEKYSRDLQIILEEFYQPMLVAGLLTSDQLTAIFLNVEELLENSQALAERLRDAVEIAVEQGDEDLLTVNIGKLFLEAAPMLHAFETYCVRQGSASLLLASLEKEKELLRIFLRVSQMENTVLRRMNLNSFLMVPVQRVTKYPLLLARLYKVTPIHHETKDCLKESQHKIELHLSHMNSETKDVPSKLWRRISSIPGRRSSSEMDLVNIKLRKIAVDVLEWNHDEAKFALEGRLLFTQPTDNNWRKGRTIKLTPVNALLVTNGKSSTSRTDPSDENLVFSRQAGIRDAALLLVRDKNGRYTLLREPLYLDRCVIAADPAWQSYFEVQELLGKDTFIFKAEDEEQTKLWYRQLQYYAQGMGAWRKRRNALANIMINGMGLRS